jgi:small neutral amino acid transporter SnatA (MarC family)
MTAKALLYTAIALVAALAVVLHLFAPQLMRHLGQAIHGAR